MQSKEEIEKEAEIEDHWGYETNEWDTFRKNKILSLLKEYNRALDIGAHEGFITRDLPTKEIHAYELSDNAAKRLPEGILRVTEPIGKYDLVLATGVLYRHYDWRKMLDMVKSHSSGTIVIAGIKGWLVDEIKELGTPVHFEEFKYREYTQQLYVFTA